MVDKKTDRVVDSYIETKEDFINELKLIELSAIQTKRNADRQYKRHIGNIQALRNKIKLD